VSKTDSGKICARYKGKKLGTYKTKEQAALAYDFHLIKMNEHPVNFPDAMDKLDWEEKLSFLIGSAISNKPKQAAETIISLI